MELYNPIKVLLVIVGPWKCDQGNLKPTCRCLVVFKSASDAGDGPKLRTTGFGVVICEFLIPPHCQVQE